MLREAQLGRDFFFFSGNRRVGQKSAQWKGCWLVRFWTLLGYGEGSGVISGQRERPSRTQGDFKGML